MKLTVIKGQGLPVTTMIKDIWVSRRRSEFVLVIGEKVYYPKASKTGKKQRPLGFPTGR